MTIYFSSLIPIIFLLLSASGKDASQDCDYLSTIGGGCPDVNACLETCRPCYRGIGIVTPGCAGPDGPFPYWVCRCYFRNGAPCPPPGPPKCPKTWPSFSNVTQNHTLHS
ncbi:hypothetical protein M5689_005830 [Euphorbia peplus]|nr:hypothetical protein M5689_005830 [Euphorbia peplus]